MIIQAFLKLDSAAFSKGISAAIEKTKALVNVGMEIGQKMKEAFDLGGELSDLAAQTGEGAGSLMVLRQAFDDTGVGAQELGQTLAFMRRALVDNGEAFDKLGLNAKALQSAGAEEQLSAIAGAIQGLASPAEQAAAAMDIFSRSGARMLTFLADGGALENARDALGSLPSIMDRNAAAFDAISDRMNRVKTRTLGFWAGLAEGLSPTIDALTTAFEQVDVAAFGERVGATIGAVVELFRTIPIKDILIASWDEFITAAGNGFLRLGLAMHQALTWPLVYVRTAFQKLIEEVIGLVAKIPGVNSALGIEGFQAQSWGDITREHRGQRAEYLDEMRAALDAGSFQTSDKTKALWQQAQDSFAARLAETQANYAGASGGGGGLRLPAVAEGAASASKIDADSLARIGGFVGAGSSSQLESLSRKTADHTKRAAEILERMESRSATGAAALWAV